MGFQKINIKKDHVKDIVVLLFFFMALIFSTKARALTIDVSSRGLTVEELVAVNGLVKKAMSILPPLVKEKMQVHLKLEIMDLGKEGRWGEAQHQILGENKILLDRSLLPDIVAGADARKNLRWATKFRTFYDIALGTILHEVAHFFDDLETSAISSSSEFLHLTYFKNNNEKSGNTLAAKSPNWYEFKSSAEAFAVNFEFFLLDPDFKCRKPLLYDFFANKIFKHAPYPNSSCVMVHKVFETGNILENDTSQYVDLDFDRLYQVHYLLADKGTDASSKWGHAMIRLVFCAPERSVKEPECLNDLSYHKVISFRAVPTSDSVSMIKGLTGKYPSFLFILPFTQVIHDYTVDELRPIKSIPLKMTDEQMKRLLFRTLEVHWSYRGKYYFISNNCAVETLNLIKTVLLNFPGLEDVDVNTPQEVLESLSELGIADLSAFDDLKYAWKKGLYYYPNDKIPKLAYLKLKTKSGYLDGITLEQFLFEMDATERSQVYHDIFEKNLKSKPELNELYASAMYLEKQIGKNTQRKLLSNAMLKFAELNSEESKQYQSKNITWTESWYYGYGIPTERDYQDYYLVPTERKKVQQNAFVDSLKKKVESLWDKELKKQLSLAQENLKYISTIAR